jgi:hypothetical protein
MRSSEEGGHFYVASLIFNPKEYICINKLLRETCTYRNCPIWDKILKEIFKEVVADPLDSA